MKKLLHISTLIIGLWFFSFASAATIDRFEIEATPTKVKVWESIDVTITAVDSWWNVVKDYAWEVLIFSQSDNAAEFPGIVEGNIYNFKASDAWVVKFENAVKFTKTWIQDISVYDNANYDIFGYTEVEITTGSTSTQSWEILIKYPENGITVWYNTFKVSGTTLKNHKIKILLNTDTSIDAISNAEWIFEAEVKNIPSGENTLSAQLLDANGKVIAKSKDVFFKVEANGPKFKSIALNPNKTDFETDTKVVVTVEATNNLTNVNLIFNDTVTQLTEWKAGTYTWVITTPTQTGTYNIDVTLKNELGLETKMPKATTLTVSAPEMAAASVETPVQVNCDDFKKELTVNNIKAIKLKSKSIISWDKVEKASSYNVYKKDKTTGNLSLIENVNENKYEIVIEWDVVQYDDFAVKAVFKDDVCNIESTDYANMTNVQTWPKEMIFIIAILSLISGVFFFRRKTS